MLLMSFLRSFRRAKPSVAAEPAPLPARPVPSEIRDGLRIVDAPSPIELVPVLDLPLRAEHRMQVLSPAHPHFVRLDGAIDPAFLRRLLADCRPESEDDPVQGLDGGYALLAGGQVVYAPECCCTLGDLCRWEEALAPWSFGWREIWIGHPCLIALRREEDVLLQGHVEPGFPEVSPNLGKPAWRIRADDLDAAVRSAGAVCRRLVPTVAEALPRPSLRAAALLLGLEADAA